MKRSSKPAVHRNPPDAYRRQSVDLAELPETHDLEHVREVVIIQHILGVGVHVAWVVHQNVHVLVQEEVVETHRAQKSACVPEMTSSRLGLTAPVLCLSAPASAALRGLYKFRPCKERVRT